MGEQKDRARPRVDRSLRHGETSQITVRQLQYFVAVGKQGNFSKAARACHVSVASLAEQMNKMEELLGTLFERGAREIRLTPTGLRVLERAEAALRSIGDIERIAKQPEAVRIGMIETVAPYLMSSLMSRRKERIIPVQARTERLLELLDERRIDAAVLAAGTFPQNLSAVRVGSEALLLASRSDDDSLPTGPASLSEIVDHEVLLLSDGHCLRDQVIDYCRIGRSTLGPLEASTLELLGAMVADGLGVTLVPEMAKESLLRMPGLRITELVERPTRELYLVSRTASGVLLTDVANTLESLMGERAGAAGSAA